MLKQAEELAKRFHYLYEMNALNYGYETRRETSVKWEDVPDNIRALMTHVCSEILKESTLPLDIQRVLDAAKRWKNTRIRIGENDLSAVAHTLAFDCHVELERAVDALEENK